MREIGLILHFIGIAMLLGSGFSHMFLGIASKRMDPEQAKSFPLNARFVGKMGNIGIILMILSGGYLMTPYWSQLGNMTLLVTKLALVVLWIVVLIVMNVVSKRMKRERTEKDAKMMKMLGMFSLPLGLAILVIAVYVFH